MDINNSFKDIKNINLYRKPLEKNDISDNNQPQNRNDFQDDPEADQYLTELLNNPNGMISVENTYQATTYDADFFMNNYEIWPETYEDIIATGIFGETPQNEDLELLADLLDNLTELTSKFILPEIIESCMENIGENPQDVFAFIKEYALATNDYINNSMFRITDMLNLAEPNQILEFVKVINQNTNIDANYLIGDLSFIISENMSLDSFSELLAFIDKEEENERHALTENLSSLIRNGIDTPAELSEISQVIKDQDIDSYNFTYYVRAGIFDTGLISGYQSAIIEAANELDVDDSDYFFNDALMCLDSEHLVNPTELKDLLIAVGGSYNSQQYLAGTLRSIHSAGFTDNAIISQVLTTITAKTDHNIPAIVNLGNAATALAERGFPKEQAIELIRICLDMPGPQIENALKSMEYGLNRFPANASAVEIVELTELVKEIAGESFSGTFSSIPLLLEIFHNYHGLQPMQISNVLNADLQELEMLFDINCLRIPSDLLPEIISNRLDLYNQVPDSNPRPLAVVLQGKTDDGDAFIQSSALFQTLINSEFRVIYLEMAVDADFINNLREATIDSFHPVQAQFLFVGGHGEQDSINLSNRSADKESADEAKMLDLGDRDILLNAGLKDCVSDNCPIISWGCSTGSGMDSQENIANLLLDIFDPDQTRTGIFVDAPRVAHTSRSRIAIGPKRYQDIPFNITPDSSVFDELFELNSDNTYSFRYRNTEQIIEAINRLRNTEAISYDLAQELIFEVYNRFEYLWTMWEDYMLDGDDRFTGMSYRATNAK